MKQAERMFILPRQTENQDLKIITLPHPRTGANARFMVRPGQVLEVQKMSERYRCWFKDNYVHKDGSMFIATEVDPLFLLLPLLEKNRKQTAESEGYFCEMDQILTEDEAYPGYAHFLEWPTLPCRLVCDTKDAGSGRVYYRLDNKMVVKWLQAKVHRMKNHLAASSDLAQSLRGGARAANYRSSAPLSDADLIKIAIGFVSDYISNDWQIKLCEAMGVPPVHVPTEKSAAQSLNTGQSAAEKHSFGSNVEVYEWEQDEISKYALDGGAKKSAEVKTPTKSLAQKKLEKVDKRGMSPLTSWLKKKDDE